MAQNHINRSAPPPQRFYNPTSSLPEYGSNAGYSHPQYGNIPNRPPVNQPYGTQPQSAYSGQRVQEPPVYAQPSIALQSNVVPTHAPSGTGNRSYSQHSKIYQQHQSASLGARSFSKNSIGGRSVGGLSQSRSLGASKASLASNKSSIQQEYHDIKARNRLTAIWYGKAKTPFQIAVIFFIIGFLVFVTGLVIILCRAVGWIFLSTDKGDFIGPGILVFGLILIAVGMKFIFDAYKISAKERRRIKFTAASESMVSIATVSSKKTDPTKTEQFASGTATQNAITRTPHGSRSTLTTV